jgi:hypothetical protein
MASVAFVDGAALRMPSCYSDIAPHRRVHPTDSGCTDDVRALCEHVRMMLRLLGEFRDLETTEVGEVTSRHTGRLLREVEVEFVCPDRLSEELNRELKAARDESSSLEGEDGTRWVVASHSYSDASGWQTWRYSVDLRQVEHLRAESLEFLGLRLVPSHYEERADRDGPIVITAQVAPSAEEDEALEQHIVEQRRLAFEAGEYFDLRRAGVQDRPLQVRFGRCLWQAGDGGARQHLLVFVSADGDDDDLRGGLLNINEPRLSNAARIALQGREIADALLEELQLAGVLSPDALERIRRRGESAWDRRSRDFAEADDLSDFH